MSGLYDRRMRASIWTSCAVLAIALTVLAGCAATGSSKPAAAKEPQGPGVARLTDGREGFVIREVARMDEDSRRQFARAVALMNEKEYVQASSLLEKVIEASPGVSAPYINLAIAYRHMEKFEPAEEHLKTALALVPGHPVASNEYGLLCRKAGRFDDARILYEKALALFPDYDPLHRNLAILCDLYLNDQACAMSHYEIYSRAKPGDKQVQIWIADLRNRMGSK